MRLFEKKYTCSICGGKDAKPVRDGNICQECWKKCGIYGFPLLQNKAFATLEEVQKRISMNNDWTAAQETRKAEFVPVMAIGNKVMVDEKNGLWQLMDGILKKKLYGSIYSFDDIEGYELCEDGESITKGGLGRAAAGGLMFGSTGAIVGGITGGKRTRVVCTKMYIEVSIKNQYIKIMIPLITGQTKKKSLVYQGAINAAKQIIEYFDKVTAVDEQTDNVLNTSEDVSIADELKKYTDLYKSGVLSDEECKSIKEKLLAKI